MMDAKTEAMDAKTEALSFEASEARPRRSRFQLSPINERRWQNFKANKRGYWSLWIFLVLFTVSLFAEFIANDKPFLIQYKGSFYTPIFSTYPETTFGGEFETEADYRDPTVACLIRTNGVESCIDEPETAQSTDGSGGWMLWPLIRYSYDTINLRPAGTPAPSPPSSGENWLGTDDQGAGRHRPR